MSTTLKHTNFISEPMGEKSVNELAGIGNVLGDRLEKLGFKKAYNVLGQFLVLDKDRELFNDWLKESCNANSKQATDCYNCLRDWCHAYL